ncbi:response regulator [Emticicia agri]|uniref:Response regulator transcription factor n=1 Tax=Emticicia agri TaxID=2492393 RepID=A0A4Q5LZC1_9BACT|nr:response regulator [Emticicia agri]RYU95214.1 response regulator transcription factor [Emticicia agri]
MTSENLKVLIVEDDVLTAQVIKETIEPAGFKVVAIARQSDEALALLINNKPDLVLLDINLDNSNLDGIALAQLINKIQPLPIIFLTGNDSPEVFKRAKLTVPFSYLVKPIQPRMLITQIELAAQYFYTNVNSDQTVINQDFFLPVKQGELKKINIAEVTYLEASGSYVIIHSVDGSEDIYAMNLKYLSQHFSFPNFYKLSRTFLINLKYLEKLDASELWMKSSTKSLSIPRERKNDLLNQIRIVRTQNAKK